jgi:hypothetical protein
VRAKTKTVVAEAILIYSAILKLRKKNFHAIFFKDFLSKSQVSIDLHKN